MKIARLKSTFIGLLVVSLSILGALTWAGGATRRLVSGGTIELRPTSLVADGSHVRVEADVADFEQGERGVRVWFLVARIGSVEPWNRSVYHSHTEERVLEKSIEHFVIDEEVHVPAGKYEIWVVMHRLGNLGKWEHAASVTASNKPVQLTDGGAGFIRATFPMLDASVQTLTTTQDGDVVVSVHNGTNRNVVLALSDQTAEIEGWRAVDAHPMRVAVVSPGEQELRFSGALGAIPTGEHRLRVRLLDVDTEVDGWRAGDPVVIDDVLHADTTVVTSFKEGWKRYSPPYGPIQIARAVLTDNTAEVEILNTGSADLLVRYQLHAAAVGSREPWRQAVASSEIEYTTVKAGESVTVRTSFISALPTGEWEASAWVHWAIAPDTGEPSYKHSDAVWLGRHVVG